MFITASRIELINTVIALLCIINLPVWLKQKVNRLKLEPMKAPGGRSTLKMIRKTGSIDLEGFL